MRLQITFLVVTVLGYSLILGDEGSKYFKDIVQVCRIVCSHIVGLHLFDY